MVLMQPCSAPISPVAQTCLSRSAALKGASCHAEDSEPQSQKTTLRSTGRRTANRKKLEQNSRFAGHNGVGVFGDGAPKTWRFGQLKTNSLGQHEKHFFASVAPNRLITVKSAVKITAETLRRGEKQGLGMAFFHFRCHQKIFFPLSYATQRLCGCPNCRPPKAWAGTLASFPCLLVHTDIIHLETCRKLCL